MKPLQAELVLPAICRRSAHAIAPRCPPLPTTLCASPACGLYYLAELCEEYVMTTKRLIGYTIQAELLLHLLLFADRLPPAALAVGIAAHLSYLRLLKPFPCELE